MTSFAEFTKKKKKQSEEGMSFRRYTGELLDIDELKEDIAPVRMTVGSTKKDEEEKKAKERTWFQKGAFDDGYQFGDVTKTILGSTADVVENVSSGIMGMGEKAVDALMYLAPAMSVSQQAGNPYYQFDIEEYRKQQEYSKEFIEKDLYDEEKIAKAIITSPAKKIGIDADKSVFGEKSDSLIQSAGQLAGTIGLQSVGVPWYLTTGATSFGGETETAFKEGAGYEQAGGSALITAGADILTEKLSGGIKFGGKTLDDVMLKPLTEKIADKTVRTITNLGIDAVGEGAEEVIASVISNLGTALYKEESIDELLTSEEAMDEYIESFIGGAVLGGGVSAISTGAEAISAKKKPAFTENEQKVIDSVVESRIAEEETDGNKVSSKKRAEIEKEVQRDLEKGYIDLDTIESTLGGETYESYKSLVDSEESLQKEFDTLNKMKQGEMTGEQVDRRTELKTKLEELKKNPTRSQLKDVLSYEVKEKVKNDRLSESYNEKARRSEKFTVDLTAYDEKQQAVVQKAVESGILNNTNRTHEFVDMIAKISADKGVSFDFTNNAKLKESGFALEGKTINGYVKDSNIALNIDSSKALNTVVGHEITHVLEGTDLYTELQQAVKDYATTKGEYDTRLQELTKVYEGVEGVNIEQELTADLVGDYLFTDSDFVNRLSVEKPNIFKKIYDEIKYLVKSVTGGKEARQLAKVQRAFEKAYKTSSNAEESGLAKFSANVKKYLETYSETQKENWKNSKKIVLYEDEVQLKQFVEDAKERKNAGKKLYFGKIKSEVAKRIKAEVSHDVEGYNCALYSDNVRKIFKDHGNEAKESPRGQRAVEVDDFSRIPEIISDPETIETGGTYNNNPVIKFSKDGVTIVGVVTDGALDLYTQTMYISTKNRSLATAIDEQAPINTPETTRSTASSDSVPQNGKNASEKVDIKKGTALNEGVQYSNISNSSNDSLPQNGENARGNIKLTEEQQEYFKDSVVRDEEGNLKVMYHGTSSGGHTVFDPYGKAKYGLFGAGTYFTDNKSVAESYTEKGKGNNKQVYETYLNITNPIDMDAQADPEAWSKALPEADFPKEGTNEKFYRAMEEYFRDAEYPKWEASETAMEVLESMGYDGITHIGGGRFNKADETRHRVYIAFQSEQIKNIDNKKPTTDADIRYSLSEDTKGGKLSDMQIEYFKDSAIRDDNGNLKVMYHGSPASFSVFDKKKAKSSGYYGRGFYFSESESHAGQYGSKYEVYLNIKNPMQSGTKRITRDQLRKFVDAVAENEDYGIENYGYDATVDSVTDDVYGKDDFAMIMDINATAIGDMVEAIQLFNEINGTNYDGIIVPTETVAFYPEQIKAVTNENPTDNPDINLSLSEESKNVAPTGKYNVYGKDIALEAPVAETVDTTDNVVDEYAPLTEAEANERDAQQSDRLNTLNEAPPEVDAPYYGEETPVEVDDPFENRDIYKVGERNQNAYMFENPEVKPYFQEEAKIMLGELQRSVKGQRTFNDQVYYDTNGESGWFGTTRETSEEIAYLLDEFNYTYASIEKGLKAIIEDNGKENNAISKRIEFMLDERLRKGHKDFETDQDIPANEGYINLLREKQIVDYSDEAFEMWARTWANENPAPPVEMPQQEENVAPTKGYEAIEPRPENLDTLEAQWAKNKMTRADKATETEEIAKILDTEPVTENQRNKRKWAIFRANVFDKGSVFEDLSLKTKNRDLMGKWNYTLYSEARAQQLMGKGDAEKGVKSLNDIRAEVENTGLTHQFYEYIYHKHNVDRMKLEERYSTEENPMQNKPVFGYNVTAEMSQEIVDQYEFAQPQFMDFAQDVYNYTNHLRQQLVDNGVISQETADLWADMYPHYVPIRRVDSKGENISVPLDTGRTGVNAPIKKATGGNTDILPLFDTMAMRTMQTYKATAKNSFGVELKNTLGTTIEKGETDVDEVIDSVAVQEDLLQEGKHGRKPTFTVFENGERVTFEITEDMYDAFKPLSDSSMLSKTSKILNTASNFHRGVLTQYNPVFILTNGIKDIQDVVINSQHPAKTYLKIPEAHKQILTKGYWYNEYMSNGGDQNSYFDSDTNTFKTENKGLAKVLDHGPLKWISEANDYIEKIPRLAEYIASREAGRSVEVSMLDSARVTTNFSAGGNLTKFLNRNGATFLNASVQGAMQQVRNVREAKANGLKGWANLATKFVVAGAPAILLNALLWDDDEDYEELSDYVKQNYYVVWKDDDGKFVRIPKGRTVAVIQDAIEQVSRVATGNDEADLKNFLELVVTNLAPSNPIDNNILSPIAQVIGNKTWYDEDLVPTRLADLPASEQFDESTDSISKWLGEKLDISPVKINYLLDQYTGGVGDVVLPMLTPEAESGDDSFAGNLIAPLKSKFTTDSVMNNQNVSNLYETSEELTTEAKKSGATDEDILSNKYINSIKAEMNELYKQKREIQNSGLPDDEKYSQVRAIQKEIVAISKEGLKGYKGVKIDGSYASVGDRHYRTNDDGEWTKITDKQLEKQTEVTSGLGISAGEYWNNKEEYDYAYEYPGKYGVAKSVGGYETYKAYSSALNDIKADKDSEGKTVSGSRKEKVLNYIIGLDADYGAKIVLFKSEYNADDTYNEDIIEYLNNRGDITYEEEVEILKELGFTVDADGTVRW